MKHTIFLFFFLNIFFLSSYAAETPDILIDNFESGDRVWSPVDAGWVEFGIVDNPSPDAVNSSAKVMRCVRKTGTNFYAGLILRGRFTVPVGSFEGEYRYAHVKFLKTSGGNVGFKIEGGPADMGVDEPYTPTGQWQEIVFDLGGAIAGNYTDFFIMVDQTANPTADIVVYIDEIVLKTDPNATTRGEDNDPSAEYKLVWQDNFDGDQLDETVWVIEVNGDGGGNNELQYYRRENISVGQDPVSGENCLIITTKKERFGNRNCTSGRLKTAGNMEFKHGKIEGRIKLPNLADGLWPAFWMMGGDYSSVGWPKCGEIDIMEMGHSSSISSGKVNRRWGGHLHWGESWAGGGYPNTGSSAETSTDLTEEFHLYTAIWTETDIKMYFDLDKNPNAAPYLTLSLGGDTNPGSIARYFHKPFYVIFNMAVGGNYPGIHNINDITAFAKAENEEPKMYVDYVRVYQKGTPDEEYHGPALSAGLDENNYQATYSLYPNPVTDKLSIAGDKLPAKIQVLSITGTLLKTAEHVDNIDVSDLLQGNYLLQIENTDRSVETYKFVKSNN